MIFNIALSALDEHGDGAVEARRGDVDPGQTQLPSLQRASDVADHPCTPTISRSWCTARVRTPKRYAKTSHALAPMGLRLSPAKTRVVHMSDGFCFLGFRIRWKRKRGTNKWYVYTFIDDRPVRTLKAKIRALTHKTSQWDLASVLTRLGHATRGWANYLNTRWLRKPSGSDDFTFWRLAHMLRARHRWNWGTAPPPSDRRHRRRRIEADGIEFFRIEKVTVSRYSYRGNKIPTPWPIPNPA